MWLLDTPTFSFEFLDGKTYLVKKMRVIPQYTQTMNVAHSANEYIDEIATKESIYGEGAENQSYKIFEANYPTIYESKFDLSQIKSLKVPLE